MKRLLILAIVVAGAGMYAANIGFYERDRRISVVEEQIPVDYVNGTVTRILEGTEGIYYKYEYPQYIIEGNFSMEDITDDFYEEIIDYDKEKEEEYLVELQGVAEGVVIHKGIGEICLTVVNRDNINVVEKAVKDNGFLDDKISEKLDILRTEFKENV